MNEELQALQQVIQDIHQLMAVLTDPNDTAVVSQCLTQLTKVQKEIMVTRQQQAPSGQQAVLSQLSGGQQPSY